MSFATLRAVARSARHLPDRMLHATRRRAAIRMLQSLPRPRSLLFLCHGNICRSPFAAGVARLLLPAGTDATSAGFIGPGRQSPPEALAVAREHSVDLSAHRSQVVTPALVEAADVVIVMDRAQRELLARELPAVSSRTVLLGDLDPEPIERRTIPDPVDQPEDAFRSSYARIERCTRALCELWQNDAGQEARA